MDGVTFDDDDGVNAGAGGGDGDVSSNGVVAAMAFDVSAQPTSASLSSNDISRLGQQLRSLVKSSWFGMPDISVDASLNSAVLCLSTFSASVSSDSRLSRDRHDRKFGSGSWSEPQMIPV